MPLYRLTREIEMDDSLVLHGDQFARETFAHRLDDAIPAEAKIAKRMQREWEQDHFKPIKPGLTTLRRAGIFTRAMQVKVSETGDQAVLLIGEPLTISSVLLRQNSKRRFMSGRVHRVLPLVDDGFTMVGESFQDFGDGPAFQPVTVLTMRRGGSGTRTMITPLKPATVA